MPKEQWGFVTAQTLLELRDRLLNAIDQMGRVGEFLLRREPWDLFFLVLGAPHRGGHFFWDLSQIDDSGLAPSTRSVLEHALVEIYQACDTVVGRLVAEAPADARILVFAVHGMGPNPGWEDRCAEILSRIQQARNELPRKGPLYTQRGRAIQRSIKHQAIKWLPAGLRDRLFASPRLRELDWRTLRYFPLPMDHAGYVRVNLRGREPQGIVAPGGEYHALCQELAEAFLSFRDIETGDPIVARVYSLDDLTPPDAPYRTRLPDLVVVWGQRSVIHSRGIQSDRYGEIRWEGRGILRSSRSGNHRDSGWFVAVGQGIPCGSSADGHHVIDVVPAVFQWLRAEPAPGFQGTPIPALVQDDIRPSILGGPVRNDGL
jgi:predicted AlkP superfamily phosphohydrolase/phosphomutase